MIVLFTISIIILFGLLSASLFALIYQFKVRYDSKKMIQDKKRKEQLYMKAINEDLIERFNISDDIIRNLNIKNKLKNSYKNIEK
jgi:hypothetical protein